MATVSSCDLPSVVIYRLLAVFAVELIAYEAIGMKLFELLLSSLVGNFSIITVLTSALNFGLLLCDAFKL